MFKIKKKKEKREINNEQIQQNQYFLQQYLYWYCHHGDGGDGDGDDGDDDMDDQDEQEKQEKENVN